MNIIFLLNVTGGDLCIVVYSIFNYLAVAAVVNQLYCILLSLVAVDFCYRLFLLPTNCRYFADPCSDGEIIDSLILREIFYT